MIILTYISGLLTAMIIVLAIVSVKTYKKYTLLLESNQHTLNISTIRTADANTRMEEIEGIIKIEKPNYLMVYGDTNSTLAGALAAKKLNIKVIHIEAGLRSFNMEMPEEINRILTDRISNVLFCPTDTAVNNLKREGFDNFDCEVLQVGDAQSLPKLFQDIGTISFIKTLFNSISVKSFLITFISSIS